MPVPMLVPFVESTCLVMERGMTGERGNFYARLHEFNGMILLLHFIRPSDSFADVGANTGSYSVLAAGVTGATYIAFVPMTSKFSRLYRNVGCNGFESLVSLRNAAR